MRPLPTAWARRRVDGAVLALEAPCGPVAVLGCHGGAGATTLALHLGGGARDCGRIPRRADGFTGRAVVLVARGTATGAGSAVEALAVFSKAGASSVVVAVIGDGPWPEPLAARARLRALAGHVPVVRVPYVARWRFEDSPSPAPRAYLRAIDQLRALLPAETHGGNQACAI